MKDEEGRGGVGGQQNKAVAQCQATIAPTSCGMGTTSAFRIYLIISQHMFDQSLLYVHHVTPLGLVPVASYELSHRHSVWSSMYMVFKVSLPNHHSLGDLPTQFFER